MFSTLLFSNTASSLTPPLSAALTFSSNKKGDEIHSVRQLSREFIKPFYRGIYEDSEETHEQPGCKTVKLLLLKKRLY